MANKKDSEKAKKPKKVSDLGGDEFKGMLLKDDTFKKYRNIVKNLKEKTDFEELTQEMLRLHAGRMSRNLYGKSPSAQSIHDASLQDSSYRSRFAEMRVKLGLSRDRLDLALDAARIHLNSVYADRVPDLRTKAERLGYFDAYLTAGLVLKAKMESLCNQLDVLIKDIDQNSHTVRHCIETLELIYSRNNNKQ